MFLCSYDIARTSFVLLFLLTASEFIKSLLQEQIECEVKMEKIQEEIEQMRSEIRYIV